MIQKIKDGNDHAFRLLVERYWMDLYRVIYAILRDQKEAEDAVQEVFLKIYLSLFRYKDQGFKAWMIRIAVNHAIDVKRKRDRRQEELTDLIDVHSISGKACVVEEEVLTRARKKRLQDKLEELPENYRNVIFDFYIEEKSQKQIANEQQIQIKTVETRLYRARKWMKKHWKEDDF